jgi:drug/metabolite transporter (DMT)-like permease
LPLGELRLLLGARCCCPSCGATAPPSRWQCGRASRSVGAINSAIPFALFAWAAQRAPAGVIAISNSMAVLFTALVAFLFFGERIALRQGVALVAGFAGVVVLAGAKTAGMSIGWAVVAGTSAAFLYGIGVNLIRHWLAGLPPVALAAATLSCAAIVLAPFALAVWPAGPKSGAAWGSAIALGVVCSGFAYALYYRLIQRIGGARAVTVTYLVPLFAVAWAWWLLGERPTMAMCLAARSSSAACARASLTQTLARCAGSAFPCVQLRGASIGSGNQGRMPWKPYGFAIPPRTTTCACSCMRWRRSRASSTSRKSPT